MKLSWLVLSAYMLHTTNALIRDPLFSDIQQDHAEAKHLALARDVGGDRTSFDHTLDQQPPQGENYAVDEADDDVDADADAELEEDNVTKRGLHDENGHVTNTADVDEIYLTKRDVPTEDEESDDRRQHHGDHEKSTVKKTDSHSFQKRWDWGRNRPPLQDSWSSGNRQPPSEEQLRRAREAAAREAARREAARQAARRAAREAADREERDRLAEDARLRHDQMRYHAELNEQLRQDAEERQRPRPARIRTRPPIIGAGGVWQAGAPYTPRTPHTPLGLQWSQSSPIRLRATHATNEEPRSADSVQWEDVPFRLAPTNSAPLTSPDSIHSTSHHPSPRRPRYASVPSDDEDLYNDSDEERNARRRSVHASTRRRSDRDEERRRSGSPRHFTQSSGRPPR